MVFRYASICIPPSTCLLIHYASVERCLMRLIPNSPLDRLYSYMLYGITYPFLAPLILRLKRKRRMVGAGLRATSMQATSGSLEPFSFCDAREKGEKKVFMPSNRILQLLPGHSLKSAVEISGFLSHRNGRICVTMSSSSRAACIRFLLGLAMDLARMLSKDTQVS